MVMRHAAVALLMLSHTADNTKASIMQNNPPTRYLIYPDKQLTHKQWPHLSKYIRQVEILNQVFNWYKVKLINTINVTINQEQYEYYEGSTFKESDKKKANERFQAVMNLLISAHLDMEKTKAQMQEEFRQAYRVIDLMDNINLNTKAGAQTYLNATIEIEKRLRHIQDLLSQMDAFVKAQALRLKQEYTK